MDPPILYYTPILVNSVVQWIMTVTHRQWLAQKRQKSKQMSFSMIKYVRANVVRDAYNGHLAPDGHRSPTDSYMHAVYEVHSYLPIS